MKITGKSSLFGNLPTLTAEFCFGLQCCTWQFVALRCTAHLTMLVKVIKTNETSQPDHQGGTNKYTGSVCKT